MRHDFKTEFLVCLDLSQDVNYVVGRAPSMGGARDLARKARTVFADDKVYITKEMVLRQALGQLQPSRQKIATNPEPLKKLEVKTTKCKCGKKEGQCVGSLGCQCNPIAMCKKADKWGSNPLDDELSSDSGSDDDELDGFDVEEDLEFEDDEEDGSDEYLNNPEELEELEESEEEESEDEEEDEESPDEDEDYQNNPGPGDDDDDDDDEGDEDDDDDDDEDDDDEDDNEDEDD